ncbi:MAG: ACP S-malonyltransferase [Eubacteriales bacterium]|nr:ACP S-malonyltransferase [Eubacteriales bacterium]
MKIALLFSGQGAQYPGMMKDLYDTETSVKNVFDNADDALGRNISTLCFEGTQEELNLTHNTQPCMLASDLAAAMALKEHGVVADVVAGFSLGEYAALAYANAIDQKDVFKLIQIRADAMQEAVAPGEGAMAAFVGATSEQVEDICSRVTKGYVVAANYNSPVQTVVSGSATGVDEACELAEKAELRCVKLAVSAPFHCALMEPAAIRLEEEFKTITFDDPSVPVYMNVDGNQYVKGDVIADLLVKQAMSPVRWVQTLENMKEAGVDTFIECGPGKTLSGLVKKTLKGVKVYRVENVKTLNDTLEALKNENS